MFRQQAEKKIKKNELKQTNTSAHIYLYSDMSCTWVLVFTAVTWPGTVFWIQENSDSRLCALSYGRDIADRCNRVLKATFLWSHLGNILQTPAGMLKYCFSAAKT